MTVRTAIWPEIKKLASERVDIRKPKSYGPNGSHGFSCEVWFDGKPLGYVEHHGRGEAHSVRCTADVKEQRDNFKAFIASLPNLYDPQSGKRTCLPGTSGTAGARRPGTDDGRP